MRWLVLAVALAYGSAGAADLPVGSERDTRVQRVNYNADDVVQVSLDSDSRFTQIVLEKGEMVATTFVGYPEGYAIDVVGNMVTVRPIDVQMGDIWVSPNEQWNTNFSITTENRVYLLDLTITDTPAYLVKYYYPTEAEQTRVAKVEKDRVAAIKALPKPIDYQNFDYWMRLGKNSDSIRPVTTGDDGKHMFITFNKYDDIPLAYEGEGEDERLVDQEVEDERPNTLRVKAILRKFTLRKGKQVVTISNRSFPGGAN